MFSLGKEHAGFVESGVGIIVASRDSQNRPVLGRGAGCRVAPSDGRVTVFVSRRKYPLLVDAIRRSRTIAVSFSEPSSNKSLQLKSAAAELIEIENGDADLVEAYLNLIAADLERIGLQEALVRTALSCAAEELAAVAFVPVAGFTQTPGPVAGNRIGT